MTDLLYEEMWRDFQQVGKVEIHRPTKSPPLTLSDVMKNGGENWEDRMLRMLRPLNSSCMACSMCELGRKHTSDNHPTTEMIFDPHVFSNMKPSRWMVVGQNPGYNECLKGEPFVGQAGEMFNKTVEKAGLSRDKFYISNAVKCYTEKNAKPTALHTERCEPFLKMEIQLLRPKLIITLGAVGFDVFCPDLKMSDWLGKITTSEKFKAKVYPVYHPSPRNMSVKERKDRFIKDIRTLCKLIKKAESI